ncbi:MAG: GTP pyrophosphokinase family protein [Candidatus Izemoplasmatales bacterium]
MKKDLILSAATQQIETLLSDFTDDQITELTQELMLVGNPDKALLNNRSIDIVNAVVDLKELMMMYSCAMKEARIKLEIFNTEYKMGYKRNPINSIYTRLKRLTSIMEKLERNGIPFSLENIENNIHDVAGLRVICSYVDDIYIIADSLKKHGNIELVAEKDYISSPKPNGYRSLHLIISVPVHFTNQIKKMKVEVQIRTIAMDFWATLEHQLKYQKQLTDGDEIASQLKECAETISATDSRMLAIRKRIEENSAELTEEDILFEKMRRIDFPIE